MITVDLKALLESLNDLCRDALEAAALYCAERTHYEITIQHWLYLLLQQVSSDMVLMLHAEEIDINALRQQILHSMESFPTGNSAKPSFSPQVFEWTQDAWLIASIDLKETRIRSAALLLALLKKRHVYNIAAGGPSFLRLNENHLTTLFPSLTQASCENVPEATATAASTQRDSNDDPFQRYCRDLNQLAASGKIDPVFGRDRDIEQLIDILARRRKNHPLLVGFAGVGKTAIVEGLALRLNAGQVPSFLQKTRLLSLDLAALEAGASIKGEFEKRLKTLTDKIKACGEPVILFIDEAHMLMGAGNPTGAQDAANLLKPMMARGEIRIIGATTWEEYKKYIEKDPALTRRFQRISIDEPSDAQTVAMLRGLKATYEQAHGVSIREEALLAAVQLSSRYISGRQQPDKAIDVLDSAAARVKLALSGNDTAWLLQQHIQALQLEATCLSEEQQLSPNDRHQDRLNALTLELSELRATLAERRLEWQTATKLAHKIVETRQRLLKGDAQDTTTLNLLLSEFQALNQHGFYSIEVNVDTVAQVVSDWSGIPLGKLLRDENSLLQALPAKIHERIKGQTMAIDAVCQRIQAAKIGLTPRDQPLGVFLLVGPSGVGKTETALACADLLYGGRQNLITINMSEFQEKHSLSRLIGSPPGYVGYGEGGVLSEAVRMRPYSVVLLDEIEKAAPDILHLFYQVFDKGQLNDGEGLEIDFKNTLIFLTSNLAADTIAAQADDTSLEAIRTTVLPELTRFILPSLLARMTIVPYHALNIEALIAISQEKCQQLSERLKQQQNIGLTIDVAVHRQIAEHCQAWGGARQIDVILQQQLFPLLTERVLKQSTRDTALFLTLDEHASWHLTEL